MAKKGYHQCTAWDMYCLHTPKEKRLSKYIYTKFYIHLYGRSPFPLSKADVRLRAILSSRITAALSGKNKSKKTMELIGCSIEQLKAHLEDRFQPGMTWENRGRSGWHIDHIRPCVYFNLSDPEEQRRCFHYSNLQPLWAIDNIRKKDKLDWHIAAGGNAK